MNASVPLYVGIDVGGTRCRIITSTDPKQATKIHRHEFLLSHRFDEDIRELITAIRTYTHGYTIAGIGLGVPGDLNKDKTTFTDPSDNLTEWSDKPVKVMLEREFHCPVSMENDGLTAALGEAYFGAGKGQDFSFVIWGTGVGGAKVQILDGQVKCTQLDWYQYFQDWEHDCGGNSIQKLYGKKASQLSSTEWQAVINSFRRHLAMFIEAMGGSGLIIFGGGVALKKKDRLLEAAAGFPSTSVKLSHLGEDAGLYGALCLLI